MAIYRVEVFKQLGKETWENEYPVSAASLSDAAAFSTDIANAERAFHSDQVLFTYTRTSTYTQGDNSFINTPVNAAGLLSGAGTGGLLPLWNVVRALFAKEASRPDFKLYRGVLGENNSESGSVVPATIALVNTAIDPLLSPTLSEFITSRNGTGITFMTVDPLIRQRDLHRRRRRSSVGPLNQA